MRLFAILTVWLFGLTVLIGAASAQHHPNGWAAVSGGNLYVTTPGGTVNSFALGSSACYGMVMGPGNQLLTVVDYDGFLLRVDPVDGTVVGTLTSALTSPRDVAVDHNGDHFVNSSSTLWRVTEAGDVTTVATLPDYSYGGMDVDIDTGALLIQNRSGDDPLFRVARNGASITTLATGADARYGISQEAATGDVFVGSCCGDSATSPETIYVARHNEGTAVVWHASPVAPVGVYSLRADRSSAAQRRLIVGAWNSTTVPQGPGGLFFVDMGTRYTHRLSTIQASLYETEILYRRNVFSVRTLPGRWTIGIRIPEDAGRSFLLAVSATGVRPGVPLPDSRSIALVPDVFTAASLTTGLGPYLLGTSGYLSATGMATATLNLNAFGPAVNGLRLWFLAVTLDGAAPLGIRTITDPHVLRVEGL